MIFKHSEWKPTARHNEEAHDCKREYVEGLGWIEVSFLLVLQGLHLRSHVPHGTNDCRADLDPAPAPRSDLAECEVGKLEDSIAEAQDVLGFDIKMDDVHGVKMLDGRGYLKDNLSTFHERWDTVKSNVIPKISLMGMFQLDGEQLSVKAHDADDIGVVSSIDQDLELISIVSLTPKKFLGDHGDLPRGTAHHEACHCGAEEESRQSQTCFLRRLRSAGPHRRRVDRRRRRRNLSASSDKSFAVGFPEREEISGNTYHPFDPT